MFDPSNVDLTAANNGEAQRQIICYLAALDSDEHWSLRKWHYALPIIILLSSFGFAIFPLWFRKKSPTSKESHLNLWLYLGARYTGAGVIIATAFIHLLDPAYDQIGNATCVGMTGTWAHFPWAPSIMMASTLAVFLVDFLLELLVEKCYGLATQIRQDDISRRGSAEAVILQASLQRRRMRLSRANGDQDPMQLEEGESHHPPDQHVVKSQSASRERSFTQQFASFLILETSILFHSAIIGLTLGSASDDFTTLLIVILFHQSLEGLGLGARMSAIPFPHAWERRRLPYILCAIYALTTPLFMWTGYGVRGHYDEGSNSANIVSGVLNAISAGILLYTGLVELLARDFIFDPDRTDKYGRLAFMVLSVFFGAGIMALLGKWA